MIRRFCAALILAATGVAFAPVLSAQVLVVSNTPVIEDGEAQASCISEMVDPETEADYPATYAVCTFSQNGSAIASWHCAGNPFASNDGTVNCDAPGTFDVSPGQTYQVTGIHGLDLFGATVDCPDSWEDYLGYVAPIVEDGDEIFPNPQDENTCVGQSGFDIATTTGQAYTMIEVVPPSASLLAKETADFQVQGGRLANWSIVSGPGTLSSSTSSQSTTYTAPDPIDSQQTAIVEACDSSMTGDCDKANITLNTVTVTIDPTSADLNGGQTQNFTATASDGKGVNWAISPTNSGGTFSSSGNTAAYVAPGAKSITSGSDLTVTATSTTDSTRKATATISLVPVTVTVNPQSPVLAVASTPVQMSASTSGFVNGTVLAWSITDAQPVGQINSSTGLYTAPTTAITSEPPPINIQACANTTGSQPPPPPTNEVCGTTQLQLSPQVANVTVNPSSWPSGQASTITITGTGFGASAPTVTISDPSISFQQTSYNPNPQSQTIQGTVTINPLAGPESVTLTVTSTSNHVNSSGTSGTITVQPVSVSVSVFPPSVTLLETQSQTFTPTITCKTATGLTCTLPNSLVACSLSPSLGTVSPPPSASCVYQATATVTGQQSVQVQLKATSVFDGAFGTASITLTPLNVTVSPLSSSIDGGQTKQFAANVTGAVNNNQNVNWSISKQQPSDPPPPGNIGQTTGLYTAPNPITANQTILVNACSVIDGVVCGQAQLTLTPISVTVSPTSVSLTPGSTQQFSATVLGATNTQVKWSMGSGPGQIDPNSGVYTAPPPPNDTQQTAVVQACTVVTPAGPTPCGTANVTLLASPDFKVSVPAAQLTQTVTPGGSASYMVTVTPLNGYTGTVNFANCPVTPPSSTIMITGCPNSVTISNSSPASFQITATSQPSTTVQNYMISVPGNDSSLGFTHTVTPNFDVVDFTIAATPSSASVSGGGSASYTITTAAAASNGFNFQVCFTVSGQPAGVIPNPNPPACINGIGTSAFSLPVSNTTQTGNFPLTITGTSTGGGTTDAHTVSPVPVLTVAPTVTNLSVASGVVGTSVTINGTNFGSTLSTVTFGGIPATSVTNWSNSSVTALVPVGTPAGTDPVVVTVNGIASNNNVTLTVFPNITGVSATVAPVNTALTITGSSFGQNQNGSSVTFSGVPSTTTVNWSDGSVTVLVPSTLTVGTYGVVITVNATVSDPSGVAPPGFTVIPGITSLSPASGGSGTSVTIGGTNLGSQGTTSVTFNGTAATPTSVSNNSIVVPVPNGLQPGVDTVVVTNGLPSSPATFTITPTITGINPSYGPTGTSVTITGNNFGNAQGTGTVTFNGVTATVNPWSNATLVTTVPTGATTGPMVVTGGGVPSSGTQFIVTSPETFYLTTANSSTNGLMTLSTSTGSAASLPSQNLSNQPAGQYLIQAFNTPTGVPDSSNTWPAGLAATFTVWMSQTAGTTGTLFPEVQLYLNSTAGTPICTTIGSAALTTTNTQYTLSCEPSQNITLTPTDQYYLWVGVDSTSDPSSTTEAQLGVGLQVRGRPASSVTVPIQ